MKGHKDILSILIIILVAIFVCLPLFVNINDINLDYDFLQALSFAKFRLQSLKEYHQISLRVPYFSGGYSLTTSPYSYALPRPVFLVSSFYYGEVIALKIDIFVTFLIGILGMYYLARYILKYNHLGALFSSLTFFLSGCLYKVLMLRGNTFLLDYFILPLLFAFFIKSVEDRKYLFLTILILIYMVQGGLQFMTILLFLFLFSCLEFKWVHIKNLLIACLFVFLLGLRKAIPMSNVLSENYYTASFYKLFGNSILTPAQLWERLRGIFQLLLTHQNYSLDINIKGYFPFYFYLGYIPVFLFLFAACFYWRKQLIWSVLFVIFALLTFATNTPLDLFKLLNKLPIFSSMYKPAKYFIPIVTFIITLGAGRLFSIVERFKKKGFVNLIFVALLIISTFDLYQTNRARRDIYPEKIPQYKRKESFFQVKNLSPNNALLTPNIPMRHSWELTRPTQYELLLQNIGKINAYTNIHLGEYAIPKYYIDWNGEDSFDVKNYTWKPNPDYKGEIHFLNNPDNKAEFQYFSPNKLIARVNVISLDTLIINQNYDKYWKSDIVNPISHNGLLALKLDKKGEYLVNFNYVPLSFYIGWAISYLTLIFAFYFFIIR